jgi:alpha-N-acetylgalactosaminidase
MFDSLLAVWIVQGWLSWERFRCDIDCVNDPDNCISEKLYMQMADHLASDGFASVGYQYVVSDQVTDCFLR